MFSDNNVSLDNSYSVHFVRVIYGSSHRVSPSIIWEGREILTIEEVNEKITLLRTLKKITEHIKGEIE